MLVDRGRVYSRRMQNARCNEINKQNTAQVQDFTSDPVKEEEERRKVTQGHGVLVDHSSHRQRPAATGHGRKHKSAHHGLAKKGTWRRACAHMLPRPRRGCVHNLWNR